jgi:putative transposase
MFRFFRLSFGVIVRLFRRRGSLVLENLVLRQQVSVLKRKKRRPRLTGMDRWFWVAVSRMRSGWKASLPVVKPETVVEWHRRGFRLYWRCKSKAKQIGRTPISKDLQQLVFRMASENPTWGAPRIHGELKMLGFDVAERIISRWMQRQPRKTDRAQRWLSFLRNHREAIVAMDFFTMPTLTFHLLYCFLIIAQDRRHVLHFNVTDHPFLGEPRHFLSPNFVCSGRKRSFSTATSFIIRYLSWQADNGCLGLWSDRPVLVQAKRQL